MPSVPTLPPLPPLPAAPAAPAAPEPVAPEPAAPVPAAPEPAKSTFAAPSTGAELSTEAKTKNAPAGDDADADDADDLDATRVAVRRPTEPPWRLILSDGSKIAVKGLVILGRNPVAHRNWPKAQLVSVPDKSKSVSKTHAMVEADAQGLWVTDLKSTNGVVVTYADGREVEANSDERLSLDDGCAIELGMFSIRVEKT